MSKQIDKSKWPRWLRDAKTENANVTITDEGAVIWHDGIWRGGVWYDGIWLSGEMHDGEWRGGVWYGGKRRGRRERK